MLLDYENLSCIILIHQTSFKSCKFRPDHQQLTDNRLEKREFDQQFQEHKSPGIQLIYKLGRQFSASLGLANAVVQFQCMPEHICPENNVDWLFCL